MNRLVSLIFILINIVDATFDKINSEQENSVHNIKICKSHDQKYSTNPHEKSRSDDQNSKNINLTPIKNLKGKRYSILGSEYKKTKTIFYKIKYKYFLLLEERKNIKITGFFSFKEYQNIDITKFLEENYFDSRIYNAKRLHGINYNLYPVLVEKFNILLFKLFNLRKLYLDLLNSTENLLDKKSDSFAKENRSCPIFNKNFSNLEYVQDYGSSGSDEDHRLESESEELDHNKKSEFVKKEKKIRDLNEYDKFNKKLFYKRTSGKDKTSKNKLFCNDKFELTYIYLYQSMFQSILTDQDLIFLNSYVNFNENEKHFFRCQTTRFYNFK